MKPEYLPPKEAAAMLSINLSTLYRWKDKGLINIYLLSPKCARVKRSEIEAYIASKSNNPGASTSAQSA